VSEAAAAKTQVLVVDDEEDILELIRYNLEREGYRVTCVADGERALKEARGSKPPDLILLDLMLPDVDGLEVCKLLKHADGTRHIPIVMVTAKGEEADVVVGLELGADDYITKPFSPRVLAARVKSVLRRHRAATDDRRIFRFADLILTPERHEAHLDGKPLDLTATEYRLLLHLMKRPGWVFSRAQIVDAARGEDYPVTDRSVDVHIVSLRKKLGNHGHWIQTVRGVGYRFQESPDAET
jgi:two-component system phosphate regulon response regulator PhoB